MKFYLKDFGCRLNQHEGDIIAERLLDAGYTRTPMRDANIVIVNGCTVTARADQKVRQFIHRVERENPGARILLTSCTAEAISKGLLAPLDSVELVSGGNRYNIGGYLAGGYSSSAEDFPSISGSGIFRARAWLKVQDGCDHRCSYCIVPLVRGSSRSRDTDDVVAQVRCLVEAGFAEIVLTGVDIGDWRDGEKRLPWLLQKVLDETELHRLRLSSLEPPGLTDELLSVIAEEERIAPHLHIPLQSGSADVLSIMGRPYYDIPLILKKMTELRKSRPECCLGTDIIVGFPAGTEADFAQTEELLQSGDIAYTHLFRFSPRPGTQAYSMKKLPEKALNERMNVLKAIDERNREEFAQRFVGQTMEFLVEQCHSGKAFGHTTNFLKVVADGKAARQTTAKVYVESAGPMQVFGRI